jgi:hypothetical protein
MAVVVPPAARAADEIGTAVAMTPAARGTVAGRLEVGASVFRDETVQTGPSGVLELQFVDKTHLALGSQSSVKLDRFVYDGSKADAVVIGLTKGAFRFATGISPKKAYRIQTPLAAIGVRGTVFAGMVGPDFIRISLEEGGLDVCSTSRPKLCASLNRPGETIDVLADGTFSRHDQAFEPALFCSHATMDAVLCASYGPGGPLNPNNSGGGGGHSLPDSKAPPSRSGPSDNGPPGGRNNSPPGGGNNSPPGGGNNSPPGGGNNSPPGGGGNSPPGGNNSPPGGGSNGSPPGGGNNGDPAGGNGSPL